MSKYLRPCLAELVGTFFLVFIGAGAICTDVATGGKLGLVGIAIAQGLALAIGVSAAMNVSGGHLNPAVTLCMWVYKKIETDKALFYIAFQLMGSLIAAGLLLMIYSSKTLSDAGFGAPTINRGIFEQAGDRTWLGLEQVWFLAIAIEIVLTFILVYAYFGTVVDPRAPKIGGFGVGTAVLIAILVGYSLTGAAMNPARAFGPTLYKAAIFGTEWRDHLVYWIGPIVGAILAGGLYLNYVMEPEKTPDPHHHHHHH